MKRTRINKLVGRRITAIRYDDKRYFIEFLSGTKDKVLFSVHVDHLFDKDGNWFDIDEVR